MKGVPPETKRFISTKEAPTPGAYSQAVRVNPLTHDLLYLAGSTANDPEAKDEACVKGGMGAQTTQILKNMLAVVRAAGGDASSFVSMTVFLKDRPPHLISENDFSVRQREARAADRRAFNDAYVAFFSEYEITAQKGNMPARTQVWVSEIPWESEDTMIEIQGVAAVPRPSEEEQSRSPSGMLWNPFGT